MSDLCWLLLKSKVRIDSTSCQSHSATCGHCGTVSCPRTRSSFYRHHLVTSQTWKNFEWITIWSVVYFSSYWPRRTLLLSLTGLLWVLESPWIFSDFQGLESPWKQTWSLKVLESVSVTAITRCVSWALMPQKCASGRGSAPDPAGGAYSAPPGP